MGIKKRFSALLLAVLLSFGVCAVDYLKVDALEVGGGIVSWETACNFLFSLLGIAPSKKTMEQYVNWDEWRSAMAESSTQYFIDNLDENDLPQGMTKQEAVEDWILSVCEGDLDKLSPCWNLYREWAKEQVVNGDASGSTPSGTVSVHLSDITSYVESVYGQDLNLGNSLVDGITIDPLIDVTAILIIVNAPNSIIGYISTNPNSTITPKLNSIGKYNFNVNLIATTQYPLYFLPSTNGGNWAISRSGSTSYLASANQNIFMYPNFSDVATTNTSTYYFPFTSIAVGDNYDSVVPAQNITNVDIINNYATTNTQEVVLDWSQIADKVGEMINTGVVDISTAIDDALDDAMDRVTSLDWSVTNYNDYVTNISNIYAYDITNEQVITKPETTIPDVIEGNVAKSDFTLNGLQYVFPFCIPWDIRDFVLILVADPVAPVIEYPIYNPVTDQNEIITLDFSQWYTVTQIFRYIFDFLLIIGLLLLARSLIGAGGGD